MLKLFVNHTIAVKKKNIIKYNNINCIFTSKCRRTSFDRIKILIFNLIFQLLADFLANLFFITFLFFKSAKKRFHKMICAFYDIFLWNFIVAVLILRQKYPINKTN